MSMRSSIGHRCAFVLAGSALVTLFLSTELNVCDGEAVLGSFLVGICFCISVGVVLIRSYGTASDDPSETLRALVHSMHITQVATMPSDKKFQDT